METKKHHFRAVFKSDHLASADLEDLIEAKKPLIFTIKEVKQLMGHSVAGKKGNFNIAYFVEDMKPLVLNAGNSKIVKYLSGTQESPFVEDWKMIRVELYIDKNVKFGKEITSGIRINPMPPRSETKPQFTEANFEKAAKAGASIVDIEKRYSITAEIKKQYLEYATGQ